MSNRITFWQWIMSLAAAFWAFPSEAVSSGPTLHLAPKGDVGSVNPAASFMYFVPLISPEPVSSYTTANTQSVHVSPAKWRVKDNSFIATCDFSFQGEGSQQTIFDLSREIRLHQRKLRNGGQLSHQLKSIVVQGDGTGRIEVEGTITNGIRTVGAVRLHFDTGASPVLIDLCDIKMINGQCLPASELVARVSTLTFRRVPGVPKMEVTVTSVKDKSAGESLWQDFKGRVKGLAANLLIDPMPVEAEGHRAMLDFGLALISGSSTFTFPPARSLLHHDVP